MGLKKTFILILQMIAICAVSIGCVYLVEHMNDIMIFNRQKYSAIPVVITGAVCIVAALIKSIIEAVQK